MDCDLMSLAAYLGAPTEPAPVWLVTALLPSVSARCGGPSEASPGAEWCFEGSRVLLQQQRARYPLAAPLSVRGSSSSSSALPNPTQSTNITMETQWSCPICCDSQDGIAYVTPCHHEFCLGCILRWVRRTSSCPLCRGRVEEIKFSVREENDYLKCVIPSSPRPSDASSQTGRAPRRLEEQEAVGTEARATVGGLLPELWAELFQDHRDLLDPVLPWLRQELGAVFGEQWWLVTGAENLILQALCLHGLDEEAVVQRVQPALGERATQLVHHLVCWFSVEARRLLRSFTAGEEEEDDGLVASSRSSSSSSHSTSSSSYREETPDSYSASSSSPADSDVEEHLRTLEATVRRSHSCPPSLPVTAQQEQPQEEPGEAAVAGSSAQGDSPSPSAPGSSRGGPRRPPNRRVSSPQDSP